MTLPAESDSFTRRILLVEDQDLTRGLLKQALEGAGFEVCAVADAASAARVVVDFDPDGALLDIELGDGPSGLDLAHSLLKRAPWLGVVFLSRLPSAALAGGEAPPELPTIAYLDKTEVASPERIISALNAVLTESASRDEHRDDLQQQRPLASLTTGQEQVLHLMAQGMSNSEIAEVRGVSVRAVENKIQRILAAMGIEPGPAVNARVLAVRAYLEATAESAGSRDGG